MPTDRGQAAGRPTISEVAAEAGVGRATAARTLGGYGHVSPELRKRVLAAADKLGYRANALARSMSTGVSHTIGVIVADIGNPFFAGVVRGICDASRAGGFDTIVLSTYEDLDEEIAATNVLIDKRVDGMIIASAAVGGRDVGHIKEALNRGVPVVLVDRAVPSLDLDAVVIDNRDAAREAVERLIAAGHRRIGFVWGPPMERPPATRRELLEAASRNLWTDGERLRGYLDALDDARIPFDPGLVMVGRKVEERVTEEVARMLALPDRITALFCTETEAVTGALRALRAAGLAYPRDVALIGFDDSAWAAVMDPPLTMIEQPVHDLGAKAAQVLLDGIRGAEPVRETHTLRSRLVERASVAPPP
ncbi:LacI family DNA-binding transcriptional regulator [Microbispora triticiradicis]|uniref:LacI family DNA-binding transcriptional regulator n=1 Tax=Microbispora triticiradicis TaxID=2200763 RepID=UPI001AD6080D|nr:LacI family DNA-binding transcriptional regulator [Microbispora triticiradicis]MBO4270464.1 substrate-binding domain-containing protein [Microbispora triticiradicis]